MVNEINLINIREILSRVMRHPLMVDITLESAIQYTLDFIGVMGLSGLYINKIVELDIHQYRSKLPCDCISIVQVKDKKSNVCLRSTTDSFHTKEARGHLHREESTFKTQNSVIYTTFKEGKIEIAYKAIPVDEEGIPMIPDNSKFLRALEAFIKKEWFSILFDMGKIQPAVLQNIQQEYAWRVGQMNMEFTLPSVSEMESISNMLNQLIPRTNEFRKGFKNLGNREYMRDQR